MRKDWQSFKRIKSKIKAGYYYLELLMPRIIKLLGNTLKNITKIKNDEKVTYLEITEVELVQSNIGNNNDYQQDLRVLNTFAFSKSFCQLLDLLPKTFIFSKIFNSGFSYIEVWLIDKVLNR